MKKLLLIFMLISCCLYGFDKDSTAITSNNNSVDKLKFDIHLSNFDILVLNLGARITLYDALSLEMGKFLAFYVAKEDWGFGLNYKLTNSGFGISLRNLYTMHDKSQLQSWYCIMPSYMPMNTDGFNFWGRVGIALRYSEKTYLDFHEYEKLYFAGEIGISYTISILGE